MSGSPGTLQPSEPEPLARSLDREAVERRRYDAILNLMPEADKADLTPEILGQNLETQREEIERMLALLKTSMDNPIEEVGDRASMPYGERFTARFVKEEDRWKVEDPE